MAGIDSASDVGVGALFRFGTRMSDGALAGGPHGLGVFPDRAGAEVGLARLPFLAPFGELLVGEIHADRPGDRVDPDRVAVLQQANRPADRRLRSEDRKSVV